MLQLGRAENGPLFEVLYKAGLLDKGPQRRIPDRIGSGQRGGKPRRGPFEGHFRRVRWRCGFHQGRRGLFSMHASTLSARPEAQNRAPVPAPSTTVLPVLRTWAVYAFASFLAPEELAAERLDQRLFVLFRQGRQA